MEGEYYGEYEYEYGGEAGEGEGPLGGFLIEPLLLPRDPEDEEEAVDPCGCDPCICEMGEGEVMGMGMDDTENEPPDVPASPDFYTDEKIPVQPADADGDGPCDCDPCDCEEKEVEVEEPCVCEPCECDQVPCVCDPCECDPPPPTDQCLCNPCECDEPPPPPPPKRERCITPPPDPFDRPFLAKLQQNLKDQQRKTCREWKPKFKGVAVTEELILDLLLKDHNGKAIMYLPGNQIYPSILK